MRGVWARAVLAAVTGAVRPSVEADSLEVEPGTVTASVDGCIVRLEAGLVPPRIWAAMTSYARGRGALEDAVAGRLQSSHLSQLMTEDWDEPLIPYPIRRSCSCDAGGGCEHVAAAGVALADEIDRDPGALLLWRGCVEPAEFEEAGDPWEGRALPELDPVRVRPAGVVLQRLGPSGIRVGDEELEEVLLRAYSAFPADAE
jgi:hypothetical protein